MNQPNLFAFATKELSQDAFICWLLKWSENRYAETNRGLHETSRRLISEFTKIPIGDLSIEQISIKRQEKNIDIVVRFNNVLLAIEDKIRSFPGKNQLSGYSEKIEKLAKGNDIHKVFFKTYHVSKKEIRKASEAGFKVFDLKQITEVLNSVPNVESEILESFIHYQRHVETDLYNFSEKPFGKWNLENYHGFCLYVSAELGLNSTFSKWRKGGAFWFPLCIREIDEGIRLSLEIKDKKMIITAPIKKEQYDKTMKAIYSIFPEELEANRNRRARSGKAPTLFIFKETLEMDSDKIHLENTLNLFQSRINKMKELKV